jgi:hypothetical protein
LAAVTVCAIIVSLWTTSRDRTRAHNQAKKGVRREAALADRATLTAALLQAGMSYSECTTSLLKDAPSRAYGEWKVSLRSVQRAGAFPELPKNDHEVAVVGVIVRDRARGNDRFNQLTFNDEVVDEIAKVLAEANGMTWQTYEHRRGLSH